jgi:Fe-S oxidoreductase
VRYNEPNIGQAAVKVLRAAGFEVRLPLGRQCCGRPAFSQGDMDKVIEMGRHNLELLSESADLPILFLEPSCYSMFVEEYIELGLPHAKKTAARCFLFEQFVDKLLESDPSAIEFAGSRLNVAIHGHCHAKALLNPAFMKRLAQRIPGCQATLLDTGCCGMAGAFGMMESNYELSKKIAEPLIAKLAAQPPGTVVVASGTSCRHQIQHLGSVSPKHMAELLAENLR